MKSMKLFSIVVGLLLASLAYGQTTVKVAPGEYVTVVGVEAPPPQPPTCAEPRPADLKLPQTCPAGTTGSWEQSASYSPAAYPQCWALGDYAPQSAPAGACTTPPPPSDAGVPLSFEDAAFASVKTSGALNLSSGQSRSNLSIVSTSGDQVVTCKGSCALDHIRIKAREGVRCVSGTISMSWVWIEVAGTGDDHADGLQCYGPGNSGAVIVKNSTFKGTNANAGYFSADNWKGSHSFENVLFTGGNFGLRIPADGGSSVSLKNVYFVKPFLYGAFLFDEVNGKKTPILQWENVRWATIKDGQLVPGALIPKP